MKIIKPGKPVNEKKPGEEPWPVGREFRCFLCGCVFRLERNDRYETAAERRPDGDKTLGMGCPSCGQRLSFSRRDQEGTAWKL